MAEGKYDLMLVPTRDKSRIRHQPWYKERLEAKYKKPTNSKDWKPRLSSSSWTFVKDGLDDFRDGRPPALENKDILIKGSTGLEPNLFGVDPSCKRLTKQKIMKNLAKEEIVYQKQLPQKRQRRKRIDEIEETLLEHPLAVYPHFEESLPPDLFEDIVELLDPAMNIADEDDHSDKKSHHSMKTASKSDDSEYLFSEPARSYSREVCSGYKSAMQCAKKNQYKWLHEPVEVNKEERAKILKKRQESPTQETGIDEVTKEFCDWVRNLGGQSNQNIEESTIYSLFASGYETKPALSVPIHVVELTNVPPELRSGITGPAKEDTKKKEQNEKIESSYTPSWVGKYHSPWYLDPKLWTAHLPPGGLQDPKENKEQQMTESKKKSNSLDKVLATLHGAKAFKDFIDAKKTRRPEFLDAVAKHQEELEAEALKSMNEEVNRDRPSTEPKQRVNSKRNTSNPNSRTASLH